MTASPLSVKTGESLSAPSVVKRRGSPAASDETIAARAQIAAQAWIDERRELQELIDHASPFEHAEFSPLLRADSGQFQHRCADHLRGDGQGSREFAARVALADRPSRLHAS